MSSLWASGLKLPIKVSLILLIPYAVPKSVHSIKVRILSIPEQSFSAVKEKSRFDATTTTNMDGWPMFQYNAQHTGHNDHSNITLPLQLKWSIQDTLRRINEVTAQNDKILISYGRGAGQARISCLSAVDGSLNWMWLLGNVWSVAQPSCGYGNVYVQVNNHTSSYIAAIEVESGELVWVVPFSAQWYRYLAPTLYNEKLLMASGFYGGMHCLDAFTGVIIWQIPGAQYERWTPAAYEDTVYKFIGSTLLAYNLNTGNLFWSLSAESTPKSGESSELVVDMGVSAVIDTLDHIAYCMNAFDHYLYAIDLDLRQYLWIDSGVPHGYGKNPVIYKNLLFVTHWGYMQVYDRMTGEKLWQFYGDDSLRHAPVAANGYVFVSSVNNTFALDIEMQTVAWSYPVGGFLTVTDKILFVSDTLNSSLYAFGDFTTAIDDDNFPIIPSDFVLRQNYPNPFNPTTKIDFSTPNRCKVEITVYNTIGQQIRILINKEISAGSHTVYWDGKDNIGKSAPSGVYFYKMTAAEFIDSKKMILLK